MDGLDFKNIELGDKHIIESFTIDSDINVCDMAFSNMLGWGMFYNFSWAVVEDSLVMRFFNSTKKEFAYLPIISKSYANVKNAINKILTRVENITMVSITSGYETFLKESFCNTVFEKNRNSYDYIYDADSLRTLSGKKLQSKRNHVNKFRQICPNYKVVDITDDNLDKCLELERAWLEGHENTESRKIESKMISTVLQNRDVLGLLAIAIEVEGEIVAFSAGSPINKVTFGVHIEKANAEINGSFATINKEFCNRIPLNYKYVNREEDMGVEGLRKSKLSYNPSVILQKDIAKIKL